MAEFGVQATELSAPQGAGSAPIAAVAGPAPQKSALPGLVEDVVNIFGKAWDASTKNKAEEAKHAHVNAYIEEQTSINTAVANGNLDAATAGARSRATFNKYYNSPYGEFVGKAQRDLMGGSELGEVVDKEKQDKEIQKSRILQAQKDGVVIYNWMSPDTVEKTLKASEDNNRAIRDFGLKREVNAERRAQSAEDRIVADAEDKQNSISLLNTLAGNGLNKMPSFIQDLSSQMEKGFPADQAQSALTAQFASIEGALVAAAKTHPELASTYRTLFDDFKVLGNKVLNPTTRAEVTQNAYNEIINRGKLAAVTNDPKLKALVVTNELFKNNPYIAIDAGPAVTGAIAYLSGMDTAGQPLPSNTPQVVGNPEVEKDVLGFLTKSMETLKNQQFKDNPKAETEITNSVNVVLKQIGEQHRLGKLKPDMLSNLSDFFAKPDYADLVKRGLIDKEANTAARQVWQVTYVPSITRTVGNRIDKATLLLQGTSGDPSLKFIDAVDIAYDQNGISFTPKALAPAKRTGIVDFNSDLRGLQENTIVQLREAKAWIERAVKQSAHMEGSTDYKKYWETHRHEYLPKVYAEKDVIVDGGPGIGPRRSLGGLVDDPRNWVKVGK